MRQKKKLKLFLMITTISAITLFETIDSIRVPTDWSEISTSFPHKLKISTQKSMYLHPKYQFIGQQNMFKSQKPHVRYIRIPQRTTSNPLVYKTMKLNYAKQNLYVPKTMHTLTLSQNVQQSNQDWVPLTTVNQKYNLAPILTNNQNSYQEHPYIRIPYNKVKTDGYNTLTAPIQKNRGLPIMQKSEALKKKDIEGDIHESFKTIEPPTHIPNFAEKIYDNDPFSREYVQKEGLESRSDDNSYDREGHENFDAPQHQTFISDHEKPLDIPTKPIYPGEGEWAKPGRMYRVFNRPEIPAKQQDRSEEEQPEGYEIFENGQERFRKAYSSHDGTLKKLLHDDKQEEYSENDNGNYKENENENQNENIDENDNDNENESNNLYEKPQIEFVPIKTYAQTRKTESTRHLPQSEAYKDASSEEEIINAPRLREVIKNTRAHTVYTEEGYEDEAYDHAGKEKKAEENDKYANLEDDFEDYKEKRKKHTNFKYDDRGHNNKGVDNESRLSHKDTLDQNEDLDFHEKYSNMQGDTDSSGAEVNNKKHKSKNNKRKANSEESWLKTIMMTGINETLVSDINDKKIEMDVLEELKTRTNPETKNLKKLQKSIKTSKISQMTNADKQVESENPILTFKSFPKSHNISSKDLYKAFTYTDPRAENLSAKKTVSMPINPMLRKNIMTKPKINENDFQTEPTLTRFKRYDREKLSKVYIRKRPKYYWERSKNRGNMKIEFNNQSNEKPNINRNNTKHIKEPIPIIKPISKLAYKNRPKRGIANEPFQIDYPILNIDKLTYSIVNVSKFQLPNPKSDLTFVKYPYYYLAESGRINKHSPLKYAEDMGNIPKKSEGGMEFYESTSNIKCPEIESSIEPISERVKKQEVTQSDFNGSKSIGKHVEPVKQMQRLERLGDKIDCMKIKYFGENPLDSPFFQEEIIKPPSIDLTFPKGKNFVLKKTPIITNMNVDETMKSVSYIQQNPKTNILSEISNSNELTNMKVIIGHLNDNTNKSNKKLQKRDTILINTEPSFKLDAIVVLDEEYRLDNDNVTKNNVVINKSENYSPENATKPQSKEDITTNKSETFTVSELGPTTDSNHKSHKETIVSTPPPPTTTGRIKMTQKVISKRRRRPSFSTKPPIQQLKSHLSEHQPEDFVIIIDTDGESLADIPLQLPLVHNQEFGKTFDISKYLPGAETEASTFDFKTPNNVQMEVFADILQHMKTATHPPQRNSKTTNLKTPMTNETLEKSILIEKTVPRTRKIRKPSRKIRMKLTNSTLPPAGDETIFNKTATRVYVDQPTSGTENNAIYNNPPISKTKTYSVKEALDINDLNKPNLNIKYPRTYTTLYLQDNHEKTIDTFTPDNYGDMPEYSSDPDHPQPNYDHSSSIHDELEEIQNPIDESHASKYLVHGNSLQYDLIFNRVHKTYVLRPVKKHQYLQSQYNSDFSPNPIYTPEFKPSVDNQIEDILIKGLKPVQDQDGLKLIIPHSKVPKLYVEKFKTFSLYPVQKFKNSKLIRVAVSPKKVLRVTTKQPLHVITSQKVPISFPLSGRHRFNYHKHNTQQSDYYNILGMVPPLITEHSIGYSNYQPVTFERHHLDSLANENTHLLSRKSFVDLQIQSSGRMETVVDTNGNPVIPFQRKYTEVDQYNRQANKYKIDKNIELMKGEVLLPGKDSNTSPSINMETDANLSRQKNSQGLRDSYGNVLDKPILNAYATVVVEMANQSKIYLNESHEPNMSSENQTEIFEKSVQENVETTTNVIVSVDSRRGEPKYENKIPKRIRLPSNDNRNLPITNRRRTKVSLPSSVENQEILTFQSINSPQLFDINHYIPDSKLMRELRKNNTLFSKQKPSDIKSEITESHSRHSYSSRFNSAEEPLPLSTEKTLQKPVILVIEKIDKPNNDSQPESVRNRRLQKPRKLDEIMNSNSEKPATTTQRIISFRRVRPIPVIRTSSLVSTSGITDSAIRKSNHPRNLNFSKSFIKSSDPVLDQKEHIISHASVNKTIRTHINGTPRQKLVVDPIALRHKARVESQAAAMEKVKEKLEINIDKYVENPHAQDKLSNFEELTTFTERNPSNNRHYEKKEHFHTTSEIININSPNNEEFVDDFENKSVDNDDEENEDDETLSKDYSEQVEIIGDLELVRNGPKHGGNYRHIDDQESEDTNHDDRRNGQIELEESEDSPENGESGIKYSSNNGDFTESKIKPKNKNPDGSNADEYTSAFYSDPNLPKKINNLKHSIISPSTAVQVNKEQTKLPAYWSKIIKDSGRRQYVYIRQ